MSGHANAPCIQILHNLEGDNERQWHPILSIIKLTVNNICLEHHHATTHRHKLCLSVGLRFKDCTDTLGTSWFDMYGKYGAGAGAHAKGAGFGGHASGYKIKIDLGSFSC